MWLLTVGQNSYSIQHTVPLKVIKVLGPNGSFEHSRINIVLVPFRSFGSGMFVGIVTYHVQVTIEVLRVIQCGTRDPLLSIRL